MAEYLLLKDFSFGAIKLSVCVQNKAVFLD